MSSSAAARESSAEARVPSPSVTTLPGRPAFFGLASLALVVGILSTAKALFTPVALSVVVAFALAPAVRRLERVVGRAVAVVAVVAIALGAVIGFGVLLQRQLVELSAQVNKYSESISKKVIALRGSDSTGLAGLSKSLDSVVRNLDAGETDREARTVRVIPAEATASERIESTLAPVIEPAARAVVVLVLVIFLLLKREDLRDRTIRLVGRGHATLTTRTLDEASERISRFLVNQAAINATFGVLVTVGLFAIGVPYAPLWGFVAAVLRFVPFVGTILSMFLPAALAFALFSGWWQVVATLGMFLGLDLLAAYFVEPVVIGSKTGVSSTAMVVSAIFWSWLWGPAGLVLSTPLTVCLAVMGKHVPRWSFLAVLLGDEPPLEDELVLYHRLLSGDEEEAQEVLDKRFHAAPRGQVFDEVIVPALLRAARDRARNDITETDHHAVVRAIHGFVESVEPEGVSREPSAAGVPREPPGRQKVLNVSPRTATDEALWAMFGQLFDPAKVELESTGSSFLSSDASEAAPPPALLVLLSIPPGGLAQTRYLCRRLKAKLPTTPILVLRPGLASRDGATDKLTKEGATKVSFTLREAKAAAEEQLLRAPS
jgi:predicted PurR-regulated permease PerM